MTGRHCDWCDDLITEQIFFCDGKGFCENCYTLLLDHTPEAIARIIRGLM